MVDLAPKEKRRKLNVLVIYSIEPAPKGAEDPDTRDHKIAQTARIKVAEGIAKEMVRVLELHGFKASHVNVEDDPERLRDALVIERPDLIINRIDEFEGDYTEHAKAIPAFLDLEDYPYSGSDTACLINCANRVHSHLFLADARVPTPKFVSVHDINSIPSTDGFDYPLIISQALDDIYEEEGHEHPLANREEVEERAIALASECTPPLLVEEFVEGKVVHAIVLGNRSLDVLPLIETVYAADEPDDGDDADSPAANNVASDDGAAYDGDASTGDAGDDQATVNAADDNDGPATSATTGAAGDEPAKLAERPARASTSMEIQAEVLEMLDVDHLEIARLPQDTADRVRALARRSFHALHCRDIAQIDFHIGSDGSPRVVNVRPMLDLGRQSAFGVAATHTEAGYEELLVSYVKLACERAKLDPRGVLLPPPPKQDSPAPQPPGNQTQPGPATEAAAEPKPETPPESAAQPEVADGVAVATVDSTTTESAGTPHTQH